MILHIRQRFTIVEQINTCFVFLDTIHLSDLFPIAIFQTSEEWFKFTKSVSVVYIIYLVYLIIYEHLSR